MNATKNSGRFVQFASLSRALMDKGLDWNNYLNYLAKNHGEVFDFVAENYQLCAEWWISEKCERYR